MPLINVHVGGERVDAYFPDHQLIVELDGGVAHGNDWRPAFEDDRRRGVDILLKTGIPTVRFTWDQITRLQKSDGIQSSSRSSRPADRAHTTVEHQPLCERAQASEKRFAGKARL